MGESPVYHSDLSSNDFLENQLNFLLKLLRKKWWLLKPTKVLGKSLMLNLHGLDLRWARHSWRVADLNVEILFFLPSFHPFISFTYLGGVKVTLGGAQGLL